MLEAYCEPFKLAVFFKSLSRRRKLLISMFSSEARFKFGLKFIWRGHYVSLIIKSVMFGLIWSGFALGLSQTSLAYAYDERSLINISGYYQSQDFSKINLDTQLPFISAENTKRNVKNPMRPAEDSKLADSFVTTLHLVSAQPAPYGALDQQLGVNREQSHTQSSKSKRPDALAESFKRMPFNTSDIVNYGLKGKADIVRNQLEYNMEAWLRGQVESSLENMSQN